MSHDVTIFSSCVCEMCRDQSKCYKQQQLWTNRKQQHVMYICSALTISFNRPQSEKTSEQNSITAAFMVMLMLLDISELNGLQNLFALLTWSAQLVVCISLEPYFLEECRIIFLRRSESFSSIANISKFLLDTQELNTNEAGIRNKLNHYAGKEILENNK